MTERRRIHLLSLGFGGDLTSKPRINDLSHLFGITHLHFHGGAAFHAEVDKKYAVVGYIAFITAVRTSSPVFWILSFSSLGLFFTFSSK